MALRAGYYGLKKKFIDKLNKWDQIIFPRSEQAVLGAKQLFKPVPVTVNGVSVTVNSDGSVNASGNPEQTTSSVRIFSPSVLLKKGSYRATLISGTNLPSDAILRIATVIDGNWSTIATSEIGADAVFTLNDDVTPLGITIGMAVTSGTAINMSNIKVLITLASDTDRTFVPPAMTNEQLTNKVAPFDFAVLNLSSTSLASFIENGPINLFKIIAFYNAPTDKPSGTSSGFGMAIIIKAAEDLGYARVIYMIGSNYYFGVYDKTNSAITWSHITVS